MIILAKFCIQFYRLTIFVTDSDYFCVDAKNAVRLMGYGNYIKRLLDFVTALLAVVFLFPLMALVWLSLLVANRGRPFFFQDRPGRDGRIFRIVKFRTMNDKKGADGKLLPDADRLTKVVTLSAKLLWMSSPSCSMCSQVICPSLGLVRCCPHTFRFIMHSTAGGLR